MKLVIYILIPIICTILFIKEVAGKHCHNSGFVAINHGTFTEITSTKCEVKDARATK